MQIRCGDWSGQKCVTGATDNRSRVRIPFSRDDCPRSHIQNFEIITCVVEHLETERESFRANRLSSVVGSTIMSRPKVLLLGIIEQ
jgi:hypothetical protein